MPPFWAKFGAVAFDNFLVYVVAVGAEILVEIWLHERFVRDLAADSRYFQAHFQRRFQGFAAGHFMPFAPAVFDGRNLVVVTGCMRIVKFPHVGSRGAACPFRLFPGVREVRWLFGRISLGISPPFSCWTSCRRRPHVRFLRFWTSRRSACRTSRGAACQCLGPPHLAHQGVPHASIEELCMKLNFLFYGSWDVCCALPSEDEFRHARKRVVNWSCMRT